MEQTLPLSLNAAVIALFVLEGLKWLLRNYVLKNPTFDFEFNGTVLTDEEYVLVAGYDASTNADTVLGTGTSASGVITISGDVELDRDMKDVKVWLVPSANWGPSTTPGSIGAPDWGNQVNYLWEAGLVWYDDTDL